MEKDFEIITNENGEKVLVSTELDSGTVSIPSGVERIAGHAFNGSRIDKLIVPQSVKIIDKEAFSGSYIEEVVLPHGLEVIDDSAFFFCTGLKKMIIPDTVTRIGNNAFYSSFFLKKIYIPKSVKTIGVNAFYECTHLDIYCEGEPSEGWVEGGIAKISYNEDVTEGFNFHRSAGSFDNSYTAEQFLGVKVSYNPERRPVHTNVSLEEFLKLSDGD